MRESTEILGRQGIYENMYRMLNAEAITTRLTVTAPQYKDFYVLCIHISSRY